MAAAVVADVETLPRNVAAVAAATVEAGDR